VYVKTPRGTGKSANGYKIALFISGEKLCEIHSIYSTVFLGIQRIAEENGYSLSMNCLPVSEATADRIADIGQGADGVIFLSEYDASIKKLPVVVPSVGVCMHSSFSGRLSIVDIDPYLSAELAVEYFLGKKVDQLLVVSKKDIPPAYRNREEVFACLWRQSGGKLKRVNLSDGMKLCDRTGYFFPTSSLLQTCSENILETTGKILADQAVVLGIDGKNLINPEFHNAPAIALDWQIAGKTAIEECLYRIKNPGSLPKRIYLPGRLAGKL
jgi:DNA-binding LacI/PurR family transcriptional regulator